MIDPIVIALHGLRSHSPAVYGSVWLAGAATSFGPCVAPRYVAITALTGTHRRPIISTLAFITGLVGSFALIGVIAGAIGTLWSMSSAIYAVLAIGLVFGGSMALVRAQPNCEQDRCGHKRELRVDASLGALFLLGAGGALVVSPCCTPVVAAIAAAASADGTPLTGALLLATYAVGHAAPLFLAGSLRPLVGRLSMRMPTQPAAIVGAVLLLALGIYYGVLI